MKTYQDLLRVKEADKGNFCISAVSEFKSTKDYMQARAGEAYYNKHNLTIEQYRKTLQTFSGRMVDDIFSSNFKLKTLFFRRLVTQQVQYVLGNGLILQEQGNKEKLGRDFDFKLQIAAKRAMASGRAFGFWNYDHLEVFGYVDTPSDAGFCPLYNEETSNLDAGVRYWHKKIGDKVQTRLTLYEADGYTDYIQKDTGEEVHLLNEKRAYKQIVTRTNNGIVEDITSENYNKLPIVPLYANDSHDSELSGIRESIDCYDLVKSGLANDIDDMSGFFWALENTGGMDDVDLAKFVQRMKTVRAASVDGDEGSKATPHTMEVPTEARTKMLEILRRDIYEDFQALDVQTLSSAAKTTQEIQAAYQAQDNKCSDFEYYITEFVEQILELAGIDDVPSFVWNRVVNQGEQTNMLLSAANYLTEDMLIKKLPFLTTDEAEKVIEERGAQSYEQFVGAE